MGQAPVVPPRWECSPSSFPGLRLLRDYPSGAPARRPGRRRHARRLPAARAPRRRVARRPAAEAGLYACLFSGLAVLAVLQFAAHGDHRHLGDLAAAGLARWASSPAATRRASLRSPRLPRFSSPRSPSSPGWRAPGCLVTFISETVMIGFKTGVGLFLASTQLPKLFGFKGGTATSGSAWGTSSRTWARPTRPRWPLGAGALVLLLLGKLSCDRRWRFGRGRRHRRGAAARPRRRAASSCSATFRRACRCSGCRRCTGPI